MKEDNKKIRKDNGKINKAVKMATIVLLIILVTMMSFFGIYTKNKNQMSNKVKDYSLAMNLDGARTIKLKLNSGTKQIIKDSEGNVIETATDEEIKEKGYIKEDVPNNSDEIKTEENYKKSKEIIEKRLKKLGVQDYITSVNENTGDITIEIPENTNTDTVVGNLNTIGKLEITDNETKELLLDNSNIKSSNVLYNTTSNGTAVYLEIEFNSEGKKKLEEISKTYVKLEENNTTNETSTENATENTATNEATTNTNETNTNTNTENSTEETKTEKKIIMKIDDEEVMTTSFEEPITTGKIQLTVGTATTDTTTLQGNVTQARNVSVVLDSGKLPIQYDIEKNQYILSNETLENQVAIGIIVVAVVIAIGIIVIIAKFKIKGILAGISYIGLTALYLLLIRYANVLISVESIFGIVTMLILNYIFTFMLLNNLENKIKYVKEDAVNKATIETYRKFFIRIVPICIMVIAFCFIKWIPISSFGMVSFWGLALIAVYNAVITRFLLKINVDEK